MGGRSTKKVRGDSSSLEEEAKAYSRKVIDKTKEDRPLTPRQQLAGLALAGLLSRSRGPVSKGDLRHEAYEWADLMLEVDSPMDFLTSL